MRANQGGVIQFFSLALFPWYATAPISKGVKCKSCKMNLHHRCQNSVPYCHGTPPMKPASSSKSAAKAGRLYSTQCVCVFALVDPFPVLLFLSPPSSVISPSFVLSTSLPLFFSLSLSLSLSLTHTHTHTHTLFLPSPPLSPPLSPLAQSKRGYLRFSPGNPVSILKTQPPTDHLMVSTLHLHLSGQDTTGPETVS